MPTPRQNTTHRPRNRSLPRTTLTRNTQLHRPQTIPTRAPAVCNTHLAVQGTPASASIEPCTSR
jgi:hypothetical protein